MDDGHWITDLFPSFAGAPAAGATAQLDAAMLNSLAHTLDVDPIDLSISLRGVLRVNGHPTAPFQLRTNTWRIDLPAAVFKAAVTGTVSATILQLAGSSALPAALLSLIAPLIFDIKRVEIAASDVAIQAQLQRQVASAPSQLDDLYLALPEATRGEMSFTEFAEVADRLVGARLAVSGPDGIRLRSPGASRGFRLILSAPSLIPSFLRVTTGESTGPDSSGQASTSAAANTFPAPASVAPNPPAPIAKATGTGFPTVFISYAQESAEHIADVARFAEFLKEECNVNVIIDQQVHPVRKNWQHWATDHILHSDYVLVIASPMCRKVGNGQAAMNEHPGLQAEMRTISDLYNADHPTWLRKILPVVLPGYSIDDIPLFLQPRNADHYRIMSMDKAGADYLLQTLLYDED